MTKPYILITNDDGIDAPGINALNEALRNVAHCSVVAPAFEASATSHAVTLHKALKVEEREGGDYPSFAVWGQPADCVKLALRKLLSQTPDFVFSGINRGPNLGISVFYSGTVGGAREGAICGIPSVALSVTSHEVKDYSLACTVALELVEYMNQNKEVIKGRSFNVNVPHIDVSEHKGLRITQQAHSMFREEFKAEPLPKGLFEYHLSGDMFVVVKDPLNDTEAVEANFTSVTPLQLDTTDHEFLHKIKDVFR